MFDSNTERKPRVLIYEEAEPETVTQYVKIEKPHYITTYVTKSTEKPTYITVYVTQNTMPTKSTDGTTPRREPTAVGTSDNEDLAKRHEAERSGIDDAVKEGEWYNKQHERYKAMEERYWREFQAKQIEEYLDKNGLLVSPYSFQIAKQCNNVYCETGYPDEDIFFDVLRKKAIEKANEAMALWAAIANYKLDLWKPPITGDSYRQVMDALKSAKKVLMDKDASPESIYNAVLVIESLLRKANEVKLTLPFREMQPTVPGTSFHYADPNEVLKRIDEMAKEYLEKLKNGEDIAPDIGTSLVWNIEKGLEYFTGWPSYVLGAVADYFEDRAKNEENPLVSGIYESLAVAARFGGGLGTAAWNTVLAFITGGLSVPIQIAAVTDSLYNAVSDPIQREAMIQAFKDPEFVTKVFLPTFMGAVVGGYAGAKLSPRLLRSSLNFVLEHYNDSGWKGAVARALLKYGEKVGTFKLYRTFTDPQKVDFWVVQDMDGNVWIYTKESGAVRVDSRLKPVMTRVAQKLEAMTKSLDDSTYQELVKAVKMASLKGDPNLVNTLDDLLDDISVMDDAQLVRNVVNFVKNHIDDPNEITSVEYFIRLTKQGKIPKETLTKFLATIDDAKYSGTIKEILGTLGNERVARIFESIRGIGSIDSDDLVTMLRFYKISGLSPDDLAPDEILHLVRKSSNLDDVLDEVESLLFKARSAGKADLPREIQRVFAYGKLKDVLPSLDDQSRSVLERVYLSAVKRALIQAGYSADEADDIIARVFPSDMIPPGFGASARIGLKGGAVVVNVGEDGISSVRQLGYAKIDENLLKSVKPGKSSDIATRFDLAEVEFDWIDDQAREALLARLRSLGVEPDEFGNIRITKDIANKLLKSGVEGNFRRLLERLVNAYSDRAFIQLAKDSKEVVLYVPRTEAPSVGYYSLATLVKYKLGELIRKVEQRLGVNSERLGEALKQKGYGSVDDMIKKELPNDIARIQTEANRLMKEQGLDPKTALELAINNYVMEASAKGDQLLMLRANLVASMLRDSVLTDSVRSLLSSPIVMTVTPDGGLLLGIAVPAGISSGLTAVESKITAQELQQRVTQLLNQGITTLTQEQLKQYVGDVGLDELSQALSLKEVVVPVTVELVNPLDVSRDLVIPVNVAQYAALSVTVPLSEVVVPVSVDVVRGVELVEEIVKPVTREQYTVLTVTEPLSEVVVPVSVDVVRGVEEVRDIIREVVGYDYVPLVVTSGNVHVVPVPVYVDVPVDVFQEVFVPALAEAGEGRSPPPSQGANLEATPAPFAAPPLGGGGGFGVLPSSPGPRRSRKHQREVVEL